MYFQYYFGPDRIPFRISNGGKVEADAALPFHGIISRGLLKRFVDHGIDQSFWYEYSHFLDTAKHHGVSGQFAIVKQLADQCYVLSFGQSALCAKLYIENFLPLSVDEDAQCDVWNIKEGHTSSVWKIVIKTSEQEEHFVLNVGRDADASLELKETSERLQRIGDKVPGINVARVNDIRIIEHCDVPGKVCVTRNEWINNSYELHSMRNKKTGENGLLVVDRFITNSNDPARIASILGRFLSVKEVQKAEADLDLFLAQAAPYLPDVPAVTINDGDVIWNGEKAIVVAIN